MYQITPSKRDLFFKYLESEGLVPGKNYSILEVAPNILLSQSLLISKKYADLYKQFLVSRRFKKDYDLIYSTGEVKGIKGIVECEDANLKVVPDKKGFRSFYTIFQAEPFDTLLIQGQPEEAFNLINAKKYLLFGDVCEIDDRETRDFYKDLLNAIQRYNIYGDEYELIHHIRSIEGSEYYLIRNKTLKRLPENAK